MRAHVLLLHTFGAGTTVSGAPPVAASVDAVIGTIDADGDGIANAGDRAVVEWWLFEFGGDLSALLQGSSLSQDGVILANPFLSAQTVQPLSPFAGAAATQQALTGPISQGLCANIPTVPALPTTPDVTVTSGQSIQTAVNLGLGQSGSGGGPWVVEVQAGTYGSLTIDANSYPSGLTVYSQDPTGAVVIGQVIIDSTGGTMTGVVTLGLLVEDPATGAIERHGFDIANSSALASGLFPAGIGGGLLVLNASGAAAHVLGNDIYGNQADHHGGGVAVYDSENVVLAHNKVFDNTAGLDPLNQTPPPQATELLGAGIYVRATEPGSIDLLCNEVFENTFANVVGAETLPKRGGGIAIVGTELFFGVLGFVTVCQNRVEANMAYEGSGIYLRCDDIVSGTLIASIYENEVLNNTPWETTQSIGGNRYVGGGVYIRAVDGGAQFFQVVGNNIHNNSVVPGSTSSIGVGNHTRSGGGLFIEQVFTNNSTLTVESNTIYENDAFLKGGGAFLDVTNGTGNTAASIYHNTIRQNHLLGTGAGVAGGGLYLGANAAFVGGNNLIWNNDAIFSSVPPGTSSIDWIWLFGFDPNTVPFTWSHLALHTSTIGQNLVGAGSSNIDPLFVAGENHLTKNSSCIDTAFLYPASQMVSQLDFDRGPRMVDMDNFQITGTDAFDRGADEYSANFIRGDANNDGAVNLPDSVTILNELFNFQAPQNCDEARDVTGDGSVQLGDPVYLNAHLFQSGPPPPAPYPTCGTKDETCDFFNTACP